MNFQLLIFIHFSFGTKRRGGLKPPQPTPRAVPAAGITKRNSCFLQFITVALFQNVMRFYNFCRWGIKHNVIITVWRQYTRNHVKSNTGKWLYDDWTVSLLFPIAIIYDWQQQRTYTRVQFFIQQRPKKKKKLNSNCVKMSLLTEVYCFFIGFHSMLMWRLTKQLSSLKKTYSYQPFSGQSPRHLF